VRVRAACAIVLGAAIPALAVAAANGARSAVLPGGWIVFAAQEGSTAPSQLFRIRVTGEGLEPITTGRSPATDPAFSPDGTRLVFARLGSGIFGVNLDGTGLHRLTSGTRDTYPVWSPDGKRIAFVRPYHAEWRLYVMSASGGGQRLLPLAPSAGRPSWTRDGKSIFIPAQGVLVKVDARRGDVQKRYGVTLDPSISQAATVSPVGTSVAFVGTRPPTGAPDCGESHCPAFALYLAPATGKPRKKIVDDTGPAGWSPDGKTLVYVSRGALTLAVVATGKTTKLTTGTEIATGDAPPAWH
jgi:Tol biopolymer transport system component